MKIAAGALLASTALGFSPAATVLAEEVRVPVMSQGDRGDSRKLPAHGVSQEQVRARFGSPTEISGPVGEPPITRWFYPTFTVYFEYDRVIHAVVRRR